MRFRLKNLRDAALRDLKRGYPDYEKYSDREKIMLTRAFNDTMNGTINGFYYISDKQFKFIHRSTKQAGCLQLSAGFYDNGVLIPCYDLQLKTAADLIREGMPSGWYQSI